MMVRHCLLACVVLTFAAPSLAQSGLPAPVAADSAPATEKDLGYVPQGFKRCGLRCYEDSQKQKWTVCGSDCLQRTVMIGDTSHTMQYEVAEDGQMTWRGGGFLGPAKSTDALISNSRNLVPRGQVAAITPSPTSKDNARLIRYGATNEVPTAKVQVGRIYSQCLVASTDELRPATAASPAQPTDETPASMTLQHCTRLNLVGPVSVEGIARGSLNYCVQQAQRDENTRFALESLMAAASDSASGSADPLGPASLLDYTHNFAVATRKCLAKGSSIASTVLDGLESHFKSSVTEEAK